MIRCLVERCIFIWLSTPCVAQALFGHPRKKSWSTSRQSLFSRVSQLRAGGSTDEALDPMVIYSSKDNEKPTRAIILMDCFCRYHGMYLGSRAQDIDGTAIVPVLSDYLYHYLMSTNPENSDEYDRMRLPQTPEAAKAWKEKIPSEIVGVYCESDSGLADAEKFRQTMDVVCRDDPDELESRRHKYLMQEVVREKTELPVLRQKLCKSLEESESFAAELFSDGNEYVVVKPFRGVASESVRLCRGTEDVASAYDAIIGSSVFGARERHDSVVVQEYLVGPEYAIDVVSRDGEHKIAAVWRYDKRPANSASFCYFQTKLVDASTDPAVKDICDYARQVLTALGVRYGLSHNEVILTADKGPMLVEVNCRQHNMDFLPLTMTCIGYNALDLMLAAFLGTEEEWDMFPAVPHLRGYGCMVHLVNYQSGLLKNVRHLDDMSKLKSFLDGEVYESFLVPGEEISPTVDIRSDAGWVQLVNEEKNGLDKDYEQIVNWMPDMFEVVEDGLAE